MSAHKCTGAERERILAYIAHEPEVNLFIYGDIENYGVDNGPVSIYAFEDENGEWDSILLKYFDCFIPYSQRDDFDAERLAAFLRPMRADIVSGKAEVVEKLSPYFPELTVRASYMCRCDEITKDALAPLPAGAELRRLGAADVDDVASLLMRIREFKTSWGDAEAAKKSAERMRIELGHGSIHYGLYENGVLVSTAHTTAANSQNAMVVGVATREGYRARGYASAVVAELCRANFAEGKRFLCLFYNNPDAGRIYRRIGFKEIGRYAMMP
jgi:predicted GNAT family acetyltransferase